jgi:hypothetical protein
MGTDEGGDLGQVGQGTDQTGWDNWRKREISVQE